MKISNSVENHLDNKLCIHEIYAGATRSICALQTGQVLLVLMISDAQSAQTQTCPQSNIITSRCCQRQTTQF